MDLLKPNKEDLEHLAQLYVICNTPHFLYRKFRNDGITKNISDFPTEKIISALLKLGSEGVSNINELAYFYAVYISLTLKDDYENVRNFYNKEGSIGFEWFPEIKSIYLTSTIPSNSFTISFQDMNYAPTVEVIQFQNKNQYETLIELNISSK